MAKNQFKPVYFVSFNSDEHQEIHCFPTEEEQLQKVFEMKGFEDLEGLLGWGILNVSTMGVNERDFVETYLEENDWETTHKVLLPLKK